MDNKIKHLGMIETIIQRMASNSFMLKGWTVTLIVGIIALGAKTPNSLYFSTAYLPVVFFCALDVYYLRLEKIFRSIYDVVRGLKEENIDFDLKPKSYEYNRDNTSYRSCLKSPSIWLFYSFLFLTVTLFIVFAVLYVNG